MFFKNLLSIVLVTIFFATFSFGQISYQRPDSRAPGGKTGPVFSVVDDSVKNIGKTWYKNTQLNKDRFPDSNKVAVGDTILVYLDEEKEILLSYIADFNTNSQWAATVRALRERTGNYNDEVMFKISPRQEDPTISAAVLFLIIISTLLALFLYDFYKRNERLKEGIREREEKEKNLKYSIPGVEVEGPPIMEHVPNFETATKEEIFCAAEYAIANTYRGKSFEIIGEVKRGVINGRMTIFFADGKNRTESFKNELGYQTTVRFTDTNEIKTVVCHASCFNPLWTSVDAEFFGTFTPTRETEIPIPRISVKEAKELGELITSEAEPVLPETREVEEEKSSSDPKEEVIKLTKLQISPDKGLNLEGNFSMKVEQLNRLVDTFTKKPDNK